MKVTLQFPDEVYDSYSSQAADLQNLGQSVSPEEVMADRLTRFKEVSPSDRVVVIDPKTRNRLEVVLSGGSLMDSADLLRKVEALADVRLGEIRLEFTPPEVKQIKRWADRNGRTPESVLKEVVDRLKMGVFDYVPS